MKVFPLYLLATTALGLSLTSCDSSTAKKEASQTSDAAAPADAGAATATSAAGSTTASSKTATTAPAEAKTSNVALPAGLKVGRWQTFLMAPRYAVHFVFEVTVENNKAIVYLVNDGPGGQQRLRCDQVRPVGDSAIISLPGTAATLVVRADGVDHLAGAWVKPDGKTAARTTLSAVYGERSPLRPDTATPDFAGTWRATFNGSSGKTHPATVVFTQQGAKVSGSLVGPDGSYRYLSGAALADGMGISGFDGRNGILLQAQKLPNGTLKGDFYSATAIHETWTAVPALPASASK